MRDGIRCREGKMGRTMAHYDTVLSELKNERELIRPYLCDTSLFLRKAIKEGKKISKIFFSCSSKISS